MTSDADADPSEPHLNERHGLWIPERFREFNRQIIFRTPRATIQHFGSQPLDAYYPMVDASHFGTEADLYAVQNPALVPTQVTIKPEGEPAETFTLDLDDQEVTDHAEW